MLAAPPRAGATAAAQPSSMTEEQDPDTRCRALHRVCSLGRKRIRGTAALAKFIQAGAASALKRKHRFCQTQDRRHAHVQSAVSASSFVLF
jgi:hypothetical protein